MPLPFPMHCIALTDATVLEFHDWLFAPWVKGLGIRDFSVAEGKVSAHATLDNAGSTPSRNHHLSLMSNSQPASSAALFCAVAPSIRGKR
jgi:hypothetical protein